MRAAVLAGTADSTTFGVGDVPRPEPGPGEVLIRVLRSGICGSDVHFVHDAWAATAFRPIILGHEAVGVVAAHGSGSGAPPVDTRVSIHPVLACGACDRCLAGRAQICRDRRVLGMDLDGTFAEYVAVPASSLVPVPDGVSDELAAIATDAIATAFHAARRGLVGPGRRVVIWGAGGLGLQAVAIARALGADEVIAVDPRAAARDRALLTGADEALHPDGALAAVTARGGADTALEFAGTADAAALAVRSLTDGGRAVLVGAGDGHVDGGRLVSFAMREREVVGSYGSSTEELGEVLALLASGALSLPAAVGAVVPLEEIVDAVALVRDGDTGGGRIVVDTAR